MHKAQRIAGISRGEPVVFAFEGEAISGFAGESVSAALFAAGHGGTRLTPKHGDARGYFCGMGVCWECVVEIEGEGQLRGCRVPVREGLRVKRVAR